MSLMDEIKNKLKRISNLKPSPALDDNLSRAKEFKENKDRFLARLGFMQRLNLKKESSRNGYNHQDCFESFEILDEGTFIGIKTLEGGDIYYEIAFPNTETAGEYSYFLVKELSNNFDTKPNFDVEHLMDIEKKKLHATTSIRSAVVTAPMQCTTSIINPATDKTFNIDYNSLHNSLPIFKIKDMLLGDLNLKKKALAQRQWHQINKLQKNI